MNLSHGLIFVGIVTFLFAFGIAVIGILDHFVQRMTYGQANAVIIGTLLLVVFIAGSLI